MSPVVAYPFEHLQLRLADGSEWQVTGVTYLTLDDTGAPVPGATEISQLDRIRAGGLDFEDMPLNLLTPQEQLHMISLIEAGLDPDLLDRWYAERKDDYA